MGKIFLIEDDYSIARGLSRILQTLHPEKEVLHFCGANESIEALKAHKGEIFLIWTDFNLTNGNGKMITDFVQATFPGVPIIACTSVANELTQMTVTKYLAKPASLKQIREAVEFATQPK